MDIFEAGMNPVFVGRNSIYRSFKRQKEEDSKEIQY
jgi:hypothetical protein